MLCRSALIVPVARALALAVSPLLAGCASQQPAAAAKATRSATVSRVGVATFSHETCTFCPNPTGIAEWEFYGPLGGERRC
jgi:hypothetical protein